MPDALLFLLLGLLGLLAHWAKGWAQGRFPGSLYAYLFIIAPRRTVATLMTFAGAMATALANIAEPGSTQSLALAFTAGYLIDSAINKG
jgi:4-hydroxybenzoate polyprenyltransferase